MNRIFIFICLAIITSVAEAQNRPKKVVAFNVEPESPGDTKVYDVSKYKTPEAVDLGLSVKWASFNLGAEKPEENGARYAWGEVVPRKNFKKENYKYFVKEENYLDTDGFPVVHEAYCVDIGENISQTEFDAATAALGGDWRMPTKWEWQELYRKCEAQETIKFGIPGVKFTAKNGNWIFIPNAHWYWTATSSYDDNAIAVRAESVIWDEDMPRYDGHCIRPVQGIMPEQESEDAIIDSNELVDHMPSFPGGTSAFWQWLAQNIKYPVEAQEKKLEGRVIVGFVVTKNGSIKDVQVVRGVHPILDKEALRVVNTMPNWIPGRQFGRSVSAKYNIPVTFKLP